MTGAMKPSQGPRIAALDPDPISRELLSLYLAPQGIELLWEGSVRAALATLASPPPDVLFCAEAALRNAHARDRDRLRSSLEHVPVVMVLEPGEEAQFSTAWPMVRRQFVKPLPLAGVLAVCEPWVKESGRAMPTAAGADLADPLAGLQALMAETGMDEAMLAELLESFLERMHAYLTDVRQAVQTQDPQQLERTAHSLKGMCANLRLHGLVSLSDALRGHGLSGDFDAASRSSERLRAEFDRVAEAVHARGPNGH